MKLLTFLKKLDEDVPRVDMSDEGRKARAEAMGFDTSQVWYHGSPQRDLTSMDPSAEKNANTVGDVEGMYFTPEQYVASGYTRPRASWGQAGKGQPKPPRGQIYSVYLRMQNPLDITDAIKGRKKGVPFSDAKRAATQAIDRSMYDSVIFRGDDMNNPEAIVFDPENVRSVDAPFVTPNSKMLMASIGESDNRLAQAKAQGFDTNTVWYHGSGEGSITTFRGNRGVAGHFTLVPSFAQQFAYDAWDNVAANMSPEEYEQDESVGETLYPVFLRMKNTFDIRNPKHAALIGLELGYAQVADYATLEDNVREIRAAGFDSYRDYEDIDDATAVAVFDPENIRSINAVFSPNYTDSTHIMASIGEAAGVRGPHEGNELELMMQGKKPLAMLELRRESPEKQEIWDKLIRSGRVVHQQGETLSPLNPRSPNRSGRWLTDFLALPDEAWRMDKLQAVYDEIERTKTMTDDQHVDVGNLLGYSPEDIKAFLDPLTPKVQQRSMNESQPTRPPAVGYHSTFPDNRDNIRMHGLDPKYSDTFEEGAVFFATGGTPDPRMDIWKADLSGLDIEYDPTQEGGDSENWWYTHQLVVPDRLTLVQKGTD